MDRYIDLAAKAGEGFINRVVHSFKNQVVQTGTVIGIADVHTGSLAHGLKAFQDLDAAFVINRGICHKCSGIQPEIIPSEPVQNPGKWLFLGVFWFHVKHACVGRVMFHVEHSARLQAHGHDQIKGIVVIGIMEHASCIRVLKFGFYLVAG